MASRRENWMASFMLYSRQCVYAFFFFLDLSRRLPLGRRLRPEACRVKITVGGGYKGGRDRY